MYNNTYHIEPEYIWGLPAYWIGISVIVIVVGLMFLYSTWEWWSALFGAAAARRARRKILKKGGAVRSFVIEVNGRHFDKSKFVHLNSDINKILTGQITSHDTNKRICRRGLDSNNILGIGHFPGSSCNYFVVWYRDPKMSFEEFRKSYEKILKRAETQKVEGKEHKPCLG
jgi:hypothetical protein